MPTSSKGAHGSAQKKNISFVKRVQKRNGLFVPFDVERISNAIYKAMLASNEGEKKDAEMLAKKVSIKLNRMAARDKGFTPHVEKIQDMVEEELILGDFAKVAKAYILYRQKRAELRSERGEVPQKVKELANESKKYFRNPLAEFVYYTTYSRWIPAEKRRETWVETVSRYVDFMKENLGNSLTEKEYKEVYEYMVSMKALGSMRLLWSAGGAARATNVAAYNCSFIGPTNWRDFGEIAYVLMCGSGLGFSVERQNTELLPIIKKQTGKKLPAMIIADSKEGWSDAIVTGLSTWAGGKDIDFDYSKIRPQGARLHTMGGRASGPDPLRNLLVFARAKMLENQGRRLAPVDVHDIICKIGEVVVMGGVRRSALISLSDLDDIEMKEAKNGQFYISHPERSMANNSVAYNEKPSSEDFLEEWLNLVKGRSGERGIFNRGGLQNQVPARRWKILKKDAHRAGLNPCGEINLKSKQFCNLSEVVARPEDTEKTLMEKVRVATILGTYQSTLTNFPYLSKEWKKNCEEERLLGVSITGQWDCPALRNEKTMQKLREVAVVTNKKYAKRFGINESTAITCVKPSGNGSQLFDSSSGCHPRYAEYYIRRVRIEVHSPLFKLLKDIGAPYHPEVGQPADSATTFVVEFPIKAPEGAVTRHSQKALDQLKYWKMLKENYTEHNPSITVQVEDDEWVMVSNWVHENWDMVGGISFLPKSDHVYKLAPYEEITKEHYEQLIEHFPEIDFSKIVLYEYDDETVGSKELACVAGTCEIDIPVDAVQSVSKGTAGVAHKES
ncbi:MAG: ribonucleoside-triphosphate reductase [Parcubacteria group bacterium]|nr:ribonucleoside-triphosphate reductase [Parcubacteria group bacterium]